MIVQEHILINKITRYIFHTGMPYHFYAFFSNCVRRLVQTRVDVLSLYKIVFLYTLLDRTCNCF